MPERAEGVHGLTDEFLNDKPIINDVICEFLDFIQDSPLIIHNASFDMKMVNAELERCGYPKLDYDRAVCTLKMARHCFPKEPAKLDDLCQRFNIDMKDRA